MPLWKNKSYNLTEDDVRYAMANSKSNAEASRFLRISDRTYKRYAEMYVDSATGKTLWDLHLNIGGAGTNKGKNTYRGATGLKSILEGKHPEYSSRAIKRRLILEGFKAEKCEYCGFDERRVTDYTVPLILVWKDGNKTNHMADNLLLICYNCFYLTMGSLYRQRRVQVDRADFGGYYDDN